MSDEEIQKIMNLTFCSEKDAIDAFSKTQDVVDACDLIMVVSNPVSKGAPKPKKISEEQKEFAKIRKNMEAIDQATQRNLMQTSQHDSSFLMSSHTLGLVQEEMSLRSDHILESHLPTQEEVARKSEMVYR